MSYDPRVLKRPKRNSAAHHHPVMRIDGARNWSKTLDHFVWFLMRAGVEPEQITKALAHCVHRHRHTKALVVPRPEVLEYSRVITQWLTDPQYLDEFGASLPLPV